MLKDSRVAVLDLTHGGAVIARKLMGIAASVAGIDVYKTLAPEELEDLEREGIRTSREPLQSPDFDILIVPVHLDPDYPMLADASRNTIPVISHHAAVGELLEGTFGSTVIEITGTRAKTSVSILLGEMLSRTKSVISHTSRGLEELRSGRIIRKGLSITPASILSAVEAVEKEGIKPGFFIFEVSLGGTGSADIGVITTIADDYTIANNTKPASEAKRSMILNAKPGSILVVHHDALRYFGACRRDVRIISFSDSINAAASVYYENLGSDGGTISYYLDSRHGRMAVGASPDYDLISYKTAFVCATAIALAMDIEPSLIEQSLREFKGVYGRMRKTNLKGKILIDNSNSGMNIKSAEKALEYARTENGRITMVLGEEAQEVCEGLDPAGVARFMDRHLDELHAMVLVGERMEPLVSRDIHKLYYAADLSKGIEIAQQITSEKDVILSCVKCFR